MRSKSEKILADKFLSMGFPYRYENPLQLKNKRTIHPDFTLLNKRTLQVYFWEHFGMMDDIKYVENQYIYRLNQYAENGIFPGEKLLFTCETLQSSISSKTVEALINKYLM